jgi:hypothetical protein
MNSWFLVHNNNTGTMENKRNQGLLWKAGLAVKSCKSLSLWDKLVVRQGSAVYNFGNTSKTDVGLLHEVKDYFFISSTKV